MIDLVLLYSYEEGWRLSVKMESNLASASGVRPIFQAGKLGKQVLWPLFWGEARALSQKKRLHCRLRSNHSQSWNHG